MNITAQRGRYLLALIATALMASLALVGLGPVSAHAVTIRTATWPATWSSPLSGSSVSVTTNYGAFDLGCPNADTTHEYTYYLTSGRTEHLGLDLDATDGDSVYAIGSGTVKSAGTIWGAASKEVLVIEHSTGTGEKFVAAYGHISIATNPATGQKWKKDDGVSAGAQIGTIVTAFTGAHLHFGLESGSGTYVDPTVEATGTGNCGHQPMGTSDPLTYLDAHPATGSGGSSYADKQIVQGPGGALYVIAGGAKFAFGSMTEFASLGYTTAGMITVSSDVINSIPNVPRNRTVLRSGSGALSVVAGGAKFAFGSMTEYYNRGYVDNQWINVPQYNSIGSAPGTLPYDLTVLQQPNGSLSVMAGGKKFAFSSMAEYYGLGYTDAQMVHVPQTPAAGLPAAPASIPGDGNVLVTPDGSVYVIAGGKKFAFSSMSDYYGLGYTDAQLRRVPLAPVTGIPTGTTTNPPRNGTVLKAGSQTVYVVAGGVLFPESTMTELAALGYGSSTIVALPDARLALYGQAPATVPANGTLLKGTSATVYLMQGGARYAFTSMTQFTSMGYQASQITYVPEAPLQALPNGGNLN